MAIMEQDCNERAQRRKKTESDASYLKEKGNEQFNEGNFENAIELYNEVSFSLYQLLTTSAQSLC